MYLYRNCADILLKVQNVENQGITFIYGQNHEKYIPYSKLYNKALYVLYNIQEKGLKQGDELIFQIDDNELFLYIFWACILGGIIPVPVPMAVNDESKAKLLRVWDTLERPHLITNYEVIEYLGNFAIGRDKELVFKYITNNTIFVNEIDAEIKAGSIYKSSLDSIAFILFSSGSTGDPKGIIASHKNILTSIQSIIKHRKIGLHDSMLFWVPLTHVMGLSTCHFVAIAANINMYIMKTDLYVQEPNLWFDKVSEHKVTLLSTQNFGLNHYLRNINEENEKKLDLSCVRFMIIGSELIPSNLCKEFLMRMSHHGLDEKILCPAYGLSETMGGISFSPLDKEFVEVSISRKCTKIGDTIFESIDANENCTFVDLGFLLDDCHIRICNDENIVLGDNIIGRIQLKGDMITSGYYNNVEATNNLFIEDGWSDTGDIGFIKDGRLVVIGRINDIIIVNGQNIYPLDIERVALECEEIADGNVVACGIVNKELQREEIVIFVAHKKSLDEFVPIANTLVRVINRKMGLEVKSVVPLEEIPKTSSGKMQRYKLVELFNNAAFDDVIEKLNILIHTNDKMLDTYENFTYVEKELLPLWNEVLGKYPQTKEDNFFEIGGNSLKATLLLLKIHKKFNVKVSIMSFFSNSTITKLGEYIDKQEKKEYHQMVVEENQEYYLASSVQKRMFVLNMFDNVGTTYNITQVMDVEGDIDINLMSEAFNYIINRHEILRTTFTSINGELMQVVHKHVKFQISYVEASEDRLEDIISKFIRPFDLTEESPLLRVKLIKLSDKKHVLVVDSHHIAMDGTSIGIFNKELSLFYTGQALQELKVQYKDFAAWQEKEIQSESFKRQEDFWKKTFNGNLPELALNTDYKRPDVQCFEGGRIINKISPELTSKLDKVAIKTGTTLFMILFSAYNVLLNKYTGQEDIIVGIPVSGRIHPDIENNIGMFVNTLPMRNYPEGMKNFANFLKEVKKNSLEIFESQNYQIELLIDTMSIHRDPARNPIFDTMFIFQNIEIDNINIEGLKFIRRSYKAPVSKFDVTMELTQVDEEIVMELEYSTKLFKAETMKNFSRHYINILEEVTKTIDIKIEDIKVLDKEERKSIVSYIKKIHEDIDIEFNFN